MNGLFADRTVGLVLVAVERGIDRAPEGLAYLVPESLASLEVGERVVVPLGRGDRPTPGWVVGRLREEECSVPRSKLKCVLERDLRSAPLPVTLVELARWISAYYCCPLGVTMAGVLPAAVKVGRGRVTRTLVDLPGVSSPEAEEGAPTADPVDGAANDEGTAGRPAGLGSERSAEGALEGGRVRVAVRGAARQRVLDVLHALDEADRPIEIHDLAHRAELSSPAPIRAMIRAGLLRAHQRTQVEAEWLADRLEASPVPEPSISQQRAIDAVSKSIGAGFSRHLLFGVTGSGKTEVYMRLMRHTLNQGKRSLLLVPEIALTPQTGGRIMARFPDVRVAVLHSGLTEAQRHQQWALVADGSAHLILGARSAVFAPIPPDSLGLVIVDEEHDPSYKQDQQPRYHGRDVAIRLAQLAACPVLLGSATPSLESWLHATRGTYTLHRLPERAPGLSIPRVQVVDFAEERRHFPDRRVRLLGPTLERAVHSTIEKDGQVLLLLNRRGYGNYVACANMRCGWMMRCAHCDAGMICHQERVDGQRVRWVRCHHCQEEQRLPQRCPTCGKGVTVFGLGTQRVEEELSLVHPRLSEPGVVQRIDGDTMRSSRELHAALTRFGRGDSRLLVGTQMIAKGLDFPGVRLVGVINADTAIHLPDFRASERTFQLIAQVAGRCGRGADAGVAIIQSFVPETPALVHAAANDFEGFARIELADRRRFGLPPWRRMVRVVVRHQDEERARSHARALAKALQPQANAHAVVLREPAPCPLARIADRWRFQIELLADGAAPLQALLASARSSGTLVPGELVAVDVDPVVLM
ncbi:MAG: primosomal protein N' [Phycisphaeraceae bacterium]|nr:primosomal protein N' [Phycisphaeraceae bacterium]